MKNEPTIVTNWDSMPPEVYAEGEIYSTRVLAQKYKEINESLNDLKLFAEWVYELGNNENEIYKHELKNRAFTVLKKIDKAI